MLKIGMMVCSVSDVLFGFLHLIESRVLFISWSFIITVIRALGAAASTIASFSVISCTFPNRLATVMIGGFSLPFFFVGIASGILSFLILAFAPNVSQFNQMESSDNELFKAIKIPSIAISAGCTASFALSQGFFSSTLEPHLRTFHIPPVLVSLVFAINGASCAVGSPFIGRLVDKCLKPKFALVMSLVLNIISFSILGPLPFLPIPQTLTVCIIGLFLQGLASGGGNVAGFIACIRSAAEAGYPADISTYALLCGIWNSSFSLRGFIGPSVAGFLSHIVGFQYATIFVIVINVILLYIVNALDDEKMGYWKKGC